MSERFLDGPLRVPRNDGVDVPDEPSNDGVNIRYLPSHERADLGGPFAQRRAAVKFAGKLGRSEWHSETNPRTLRTP